jgi:hypothetical protein
VTLRRQNEVAGSLLTAFNFAPQSISNKAAEPLRRLARVDAAGALQLPRLLPDLAEQLGVRQSRTRPSGYPNDRRWWLDKTGQMIAAAGQPAQFASMWIPISNNRWSPSTYVGGRRRYKPQDWCSYLRSVHGFWEQHGWLGAYPYLYGMDEPGASRFRVVESQAKATHSCFAGGHVLVTGKPTAQNRFLWNGGKDDVDAWVVLASRYYGQYTNPPLSRRGISHARQELDADQRGAAPPQADLDVHVRRRVPPQPRELRAFTSHRAASDAAGVSGIGGWGGGLRGLGGLRGDHPGFCIGQGTTDLCEGQPPSFSERTRPKGSLRP